MAIDSTISTRDFATARNWLTQFSADEVITAREFAALPAYSPLKGLMSQLKDLPRNEAWVRLNAIESDYNRRYSASQRITTPLAGAFDVVPGPDPNRAQKLQRLDAAVSAAQRGDYATAIPALEELIPNIFIANRERRATARHWLATAYYATKQYAKAADEYRTLVAHEPNYAGREQAMLGMIMATSVQSRGVEHDRGPSQATVQDCDRFLAAYPNSRYRDRVEQLRSKALGTLAQSDLDVAQFHFNNAETFYTSAADRERFYNATAYRARILLDDPRYRAAGRDPQALYLLALAYKELGRVGDARVVYQQLAQMYPTWEGTRQVAERLRG